jgi:uncharacterized protein
VRGLGTLINVAAVLAGTIAGMLAGERLPERTRTTILQAVGIVVVGLGVIGLQDSRNVVFPLVALVLGALIGEAIGIEERVEGLGERLRARFARRGHNATFVEGFVTASLLFCVGPLAILGSIDDGLRADPQLLIVKSTLDGVVAVVFAATLGWGVGFAILPIIAYQGLLTLAAGAADSVLTARMVAEISATGSVLVAGIGLRLLDLVHVRVASLLPAVVIVPILVALFAR